MILNPTRRQAPPASQLRDAALGYGERGWHIIPLHSIANGSCTCGKSDCSSPGKHPRTSSGLKDGTTDSYQIRDWWQQWPTANIGIATGEASGLVVLDIDKRHSGFDSLGQLEELHGEFPAGVEALTGGGGVHYYFQHPGGTIKNRTNLLPGIDIRGDGGYVVAAPSNHISGELYCWGKGSSPHEAKPAVMPGWLLELLTEKPAAPPRQPGTNGNGTSSRETLLQRAQQYVAKADSAVEGSRNDASFRLSGHLAAMVDVAGNRLSEAEIHSLLSGWNLRNVPRLDDSELRQATNSGMQNGTARPDKVVTDTTDIFSKLRFGQQQAPGEPEKNPNPIRKYTFGELAAEFPVLNKPVVHGLFRSGETVNLIANPKVGKSWLGYHLALSIISGQEWLGFSTRPGKVLLIDNELHPQTIANRIPKVAAELELFPDDYCDKLDVWPLRGNLRPLYRLLEEFDGLKETYQVIILDAKYRFSTGKSESDNAAETELYNLIDCLAAITGAAIVLIHHSSKGSQSEKRVTDVGSGAGAQSRAADCHIILREHEDVDVFVLDAAVRSFKPVEPLAIRWEFPLWRVTGADTSLLKGKKTQREEKQDEDDKRGKDAIIEALLAGPATTKKLLAKAKLGRTRADRLLGQLESDGHIRSRKAKVGGNQCRVYRLAKTPTGGGWSMTRRPPPDHPRRVCVYATTT